ncbi:GntR family transcriptional regulator [Clostridium sp. MCC353]|uniref:GntR family transcriptional regulator n=1 Tax=Clostridium sp. MCC353 TaxID=2592646 RepID=UPI001C02E432|nr:GntR family transcriptional regulator [Clostridium sp. MCC353]MBT9779543.1 GntR family transcriptional regulator [Clostridium sp. MCC353]
MEVHPMVKANLSNSVKNYLYQYIRNVDLKGNMKLPSENEISAKLGVSRVTIRRALDELEKEGMILRIHGRGTFINPEAVKIQVNLMPGEEFCRLVELCGYQASFQVISMERKEADEETRQILELDQGEEIYVVEKVYMADGHPAIISIDRFACSLVGDSLSEEAVKTTSTFDIIRQCAGNFVVRDKIRMETMDRETMCRFAKPGRLMECSSALVFHGVNYNQENRPIIYDTEFYDTRYIKFSLLRVKNVYEN